MLRGERSDPHFLWGLNASADRITSAQPPSSPSMLTRWLESRKEGLGATWRSTDYLEGRLPWMDRPRFRPPHRHGQERRQYLKQMKLSDQFACDGACASPPSWRSDRCFDERLSGLCSVPLRHLAQPLAIERPSAERARERRRKFADLVRSELPDEILKLGRRNKADLRST